MKKFNNYIEFIKSNDKSIHSIFEILFLPGVQAIWFHRIAHFLYKNRLYTLARIINTLSRFFTGVDIHPGATIGSPIYIDHATGVVIGEQAIVGDNVVIYHGVTLGAKEQSNSKKRHPTIGNNVILGCNSTILGDVTISDNSLIKASSLITKDV